MSQQPQPKQSALQRLATAQQIREWRDEGLLTSAQQENAERLLCDRLDWELWISRLLLLMATAFLLFAVVFFFAYNWAEIKPLHKLLLVEGAIAVCLAGAWWRGFQDLVGQMLLLAASVLVGVFLGVFGQIYQTGADSYTLFVAWAVLILPWVILGQSGALWMFWLLLINLGTGIYYSEMLPRHFPIIPIMMMLNIVALSLREFAALRGAKCCMEEWQRWVLVLGILGVLTFMVWLRIVWDSYMDGGINLTPAVYTGVLIGGFIFYRYVLRNLFVISMLMLSACIILCTLIGRGIFEGLQEPVFSFFIMGFIVVGIFAIGFFILRAISRQIAQEVRERDQLHQENPAT
ncbi:MAG: DUF2157 domain-containing protein [Candidatus Methylacidiphilales bacterium]|nr:DUF2157 domain-containing protein [Candidatus Methylacidiphilales bacterium]